MNPPFVLHPEAACDIEEIWEYIAQDSVTAAGRVREDILEAIRDTVRFPTKVTAARTSPRGRCDSSLYATI